MASDGKPEILFVGSMPQWFMERMARDFSLLELQKAKDQAAFLKEVGPRIRAIGAAGPVERLLIEALPELGLIAGMGAGYERLDVVAAGERGIMVTNTPGVTDECVADMAFALLLAVGRHIVAGDRFVRAGKWPGNSYPLVSRVNGRRLGILGLGRIGLAIARRAEAFRMPVAYHNRKARQDLAYRHHPSLEDLAADSDYLVVACPGGPGTHRIVNAAVLRALGPKGIIVNIARGSIIDEPALLRALQDGTVAGAGLDVFEFEPEMDAAFMKLDNVVLTPHRGGGTYETWEDACDLVKANLAQFFKDGSVLTPVPEMRKKQMKRAGD
ncbi:MAG: 2-hydroxyacid dehydrogenase [Proteobacteria bacterium]|nr:2-hydroxyacid dehydrogenase [Pseudomonadota bacterium]MBI3496814.1 2-hydroxyacid dehydrogenase [Pseudomonadota bacterium]